MEGKQALSAMSDDSRLHFRIHPQSAGHSQTGVGKVLQLRQLSQKSGPGKGERRMDKPLLR